MRNLLIILVTTVLFFIVGHFYYTKSEKRYINKSFIQTPIHQDDFSINPILSASNFNDILNLYFINLQSNQGINSVPAISDKDHDRFNAFIDDIVSYTIKSQHSHIAIQTIYTDKKSLDEFIAWATDIMNQYAAEQFEPIRQKKEHEAKLLQDEKASFEAIRSALLAGYQKLINNEKQKSTATGDLNSETLSKTLSLTSATRFNSEIALYDGKISILERRIELLKNEMQLRPAVVVGDFSDPTPYFPNRPKIYVLSITGGFVFGVFLIFLKKYVNK